jgi:serine protease Do
MRKSIFITALIMPLLVIAAAADSHAHNGSESFGFSSEDFGGSSYLGVDTSDITPDRLAPLHLKDESGVEITMVDEDAPAGKAGLKEHDVILTLNGEKVASVEQLRRMIRETPSGRVIALGISRNGQPMTVKVQLADRKNSYSYFVKPDGKEFHFEMPPMPQLPDFDVPVSVVMVHSSLRSGLMVENLTPQLGDYFGVRNGQGVLVRSVEKGSRAEKAGFRAGDVIIKINGEPVHDSSDFSHALRSGKNNSATVNVLRDRKEQTITLTLPERKESELNGASFEIPQFDAETGRELGELASEWAHVGPEMEEAIHQSLDQIGPAVEEAQKDFSKQQGEYKKQIQEMQRQLREHQQELKREWRKSLRSGHADI